MANGTCHGLAEINQRRADHGRQQRIAGEAKQMKRDARFPHALDMPLAVDILAQRAHEPGGLEIARRHQHAGGGDDNGRQRPQGQGDDQHRVQQQTPSPAEFFGEGIAFEREIGRGNPRAQKIHAPPEYQQPEHQKILAAVKWNRDVHYFFP